MGQIVVRQLDDATIARLKVAARQREMSVEALAREALARAADLTVEEKRAAVRRMHAWSEGAKLPGVRQTAGIDLIRQDRER